MLLKYISRNFSFKLFFALILVSGIYPARATVSPISHFLLKHQHIIILPTENISNVSTPKMIMELSQFSPTDNKIFGLYSFHRNKKNQHQELLQQQRVTHQNDTLNAIMTEIVKQIKSNAAWSEKRNFVFVLLFLILGVMCTITFNLWRTLGATICRPALRIENKV